MISLNSIRLAALGDRRSPIDRRFLLTVLAAGASGFLAAPVWAATGKIEVTEYKDPQCGCCHGYAEYLSANGFAVKVVDTHDLPLINERYGVPSELQGCHLSLIGGYVVAGHVPVGIIHRLLTEKPVIVGITLPGMPEGSPGMTGTKRAPFRIYALSKEAPQIYAVE